MSFAPRPDALQARVGAVALVTLGAMLAFEGAKELVVPAALTRWQSHWITMVFATAVAAAASAVVFRIYEREAKGRLKAELSLRASEERLRTFLRLTSEGIARFELDTPLAADDPPAQQVDQILRGARLVECNAAFGRMLRRDPEERLEGLHLTDLAPAHDLITALSEFVRLGYRLDAREQLNICRDGASAWTRANLVGLVEDGHLTTIWLSQGDITVQKTAEEDLRTRGRILEAVAFSSARFLRSGAWADHAPEALARLGNATGVGCAYIFQNREAPDGALFSSLKHEWTVPGAPPLADNPQFRDFPWAAAGPVRSRLSGGEPLAGAVRDLPEAGQRLLGGVGIQSVLIVPILVEERWWGLLGLGEFRFERSWSSAEVEALRTAAVSLGAAVAREEGELALRASEKKYHDIFDYSPIGIYQALPDGTLTTANKAFARLLGHDRAEDVLGLNVARDVYSDPEERGRLIARYERQGHGTQAELSLKRRDGTPFWAEMAAHVIKGSTGETLYFETFIQDITARKVAEAGLRESEERYRLLFEGNPLPMLVYDPDTLSLVTANEAAVQQYGYSREELSTLSVLDLAMPDDPDIERLLATRGQARPDVVHVGLRQQRRKDGTTLDSDLTGLAITFGGRPARLVLLRDVTAERHAELEQARLRLALEREAAEWQRTVDAVDTALFILDPELRMKRMNRAARDLSGEAVLAGSERTIHALVDKEPWQTGVGLIETARAAGAAASGQARDSTGTHTWDLTAYVSAAAAGREERIIFVVRDISRLVALQQSLRHSETMAALGSLVAGVAHEVRNPLFSISANVDALEVELGEHPGAGEVFAVLRTEVQRLNALMNDLLEYGRPHALEVGPGALFDVVEGATASTRALAHAARIEVVNAVPGDLVLPMDRRRLEQVFQNLIVNSIQHLKEGGSVSIRATTAQEDGREWVLCSAEDTGPGFREEDLPHAFEPFFTRRHGGTGLGLSIVARIVDDHGGAVQAHNGREGGAVVALRLPR